MGADLTINSVYNENEAKYQDEYNSAIERRDAAVQGTKEYRLAQNNVMRIYDKMTAKGYFRDSYNGTNVLWLLGLSWWKDVVPMVDSDGMLSVENARKFLTLLTSLPLQTVTAETLKENHCAVDDTNTVESWNAFFQNKHKKLVAFVKLAIKLNESIYASL